MDLHQRITDRKGEFLLFAVTPPRLSTPPERTREIAQVTLERIAPIGIDGLILYDIFDESDRNPEERPFPFAHTLDPAEYLRRDLSELDVPAIVYRATGKYPEADLRGWLEAQDCERTLSVFVGASSKDREVATSLRRAQELRREASPDLLLGAVAIPERHTQKGDEHLRMIAKQEAGVSYFVTQVVYDVTAAKNLVSDYKYACDERGIDPVPIVFTYSVCGSLKTLEFLQWLGVHVPGWIQNELAHATDTLEASYDQAIASATNLIEFCRRLGVPVGLNIESVSIRKVEIEASVRLACHLRDELRR
ncbi:MAG: methylenetetrahydrofolate reductase [Nocardioides sp.]|nr:methylenetetrahydrofolate reductase [Nocardioides sp.]